MINALNSISMDQSTDFEKVDMSTKTEDTANTAEVAAGDSGDSVVLVMEETAVVEGSGKNEKSVVELVEQLEEAAKDNEAFDGDEKSEAATERNFKAVNIGIIGAGVSGLVTAR